MQSISPYAFVSEIFLNSSRKEFTGGQQSAFLIRLPNTQSQLPERDMLGNCETWLYRFHKRMRLLF